MNRFSHVAFLLAAGCLLSAGCGRTPPASYRLNMVEATKQRLTTEQERQVATVLLAMFGTPDEPVALPETGLDEAKLRLASGPVRSDIVGRKNGLYREHCAHCHGVTGDGMGPTAAFLKPYPRDYRPGIFKFKSTERADKPTHADLLRILRNGIAGTSMPSFALLSEPQIDALVEYVKYLSIRGETELSLMRAYFELDDDAQGILPETREFLVDETLTPIAEKWKSAAAAQIVVPDMPADIDLAESIAKGKELFYGDKANCVKCHGVTGLGDGQANDYDDWSKAIVEINKEIKGGLAKAGETSTSGMSAEDAAEHRKQVAWLGRFSHVVDGDALVPRTIPPRNLRLGVYRGGRRPLDLYYRIHAGINGAPMPAAKGTVPPEDIWHIVNYIRSLPYEFDGELGADRPMVARDRF
ncbi:MAG: cytochrome c [Planctomycetia bacterium]|nr:cytochrome c [Planctomycetia bacterium]